MAALRIGADGSGYVEIARPRREPSRAGGGSWERPCCSSTARSARDPGRRWSPACPGVRCLVLDRPGWGHQHAGRVSAKRRTVTFVADLLRRVARFARHRSGGRGRRVDRRRVGAQPGRTPSGRGSAGSSCSAADRSSPMSACPASSGWWPRRSARSSSGCRSTRIALLLHPARQRARAEPRRTAACPEPARRVARRRRQRHARDASRARRWSAGIVDGSGIAAGLHCSKTTSSGRIDAADAVRLRDRRPHRQTPRSGGAFTDGAAQRLR